MINIVEIKPPKKFSGLSSFLIDFEYNKIFVNILKSLPVASFHKKDLLWEIPDNELALVLDQFVKYDNISLKLLDKKEIKFNKQADLAEFSDLKVSPFKYQITAVNFILENKKCLLLDDMGLGKTFELISAAHVLHKRGIIEHAMIICGVDSLRQNWKAEIQKFSNESVCVLGEQISKSGKITYTSVEERCAQLKNKIEEFFIVVNVATIRDDKFVSAFKDSVNNIGLIAFDECHRLASKTSQQSSNLLKLNADYKIGLTGTLITNSPLSCYVPLYWTENDHATLGNYKAQFCVFGGFNNSQVIGYKNLDLLKEEIDSCSLRRTIDSVRDDRPEIIYKDELIERSDEFKKFYDAIKHGVKEEADKINLSTANLLALTTRLRQATSCPNVLTTKDIISPKILRCCQLTEDLIAADKKVVILTAFKESVYKLGLLLKQYSPLLNTGDSSETELINNRTKFQTDPAYKVFIGTAAKVSTGFTLNASQYLIMLDEAWGAYQNEQAHRRIYRINNKNSAIIITLITKGTIDEHVHYIAAKKQELSDYMVDGKENTISNSLKRDMRDIINNL